MFKLLLCLSLVVCALALPRVTRDAPADPAAADVEVGERFGGFGGGGFGGSSSQAQASASSQSFGGGGGGGMF